MAQATAARRRGTPTPEEERGAVYETALEVLGLLLQGPIRPSDLMYALNVSRKTVDRILRALERAGLRLWTRKDGLAVYYWTTKAELLRRLGV